MMTSKTWLWLTATAMTLNITACDMSDEAGDTDGPVVSFRTSGGDPFPPPKLNTNFLGEDETIPLSSIPLVDDPNAGVRLHAVWTQSCAGGGLYYTSDLAGGLGITLNGKGKLNPAYFKKYGNPAVTCTVTNWVGTVWAVMIANGVGGWDNHYLMILAVDTDEGGTPIYQWGRYTGGDNSFTPTFYTPTCAEDEFAVGAELVHINYAYLLKDLAVDEATGDFSVAPDKMYMACLSGIVGKTARWGYKPWKVGIGMDGHERASRVGRADYCGHGQPFTVQGNPLQIHDKYGVSNFVNTDFPFEAAWDLDGKAICIDTPRHIPLRGTVIECDDTPLPECTDNDVTNATFVTRIAHWPEPMEP